MINPLEVLTDLNVDPYFLVGILQKEAAFEVKQQGGVSGGTQYCLWLAQKLTNAIVASKVLEMSSFTIQNTSATTAQRLILRMINSAGQTTGASTTDETLAAYVVEWDASTDKLVTGYKVFLGTKSKTYTQSTTVGNTTSFTLNNLTKGQTYFTAVQSISPGGSSVMSNEVTFVA